MTSVHFTVNDKYDKYIFHSWWQVSRVYASSGEGRSSPVVVQLQTQVFLNSVLTWWFDFEMRKDGESGDWVDWR